MRQRSLHAPRYGTLTAQAAVQAIAALRAGTWTVHALQDHFPASEEAELSAVPDATLGKLAMGTYNDCP